MWVRCRFLVAEIGASYPGFISMCSLSITYTYQYEPQWSTMECSQPAAWTTNRSLLVTSHAKAFPGKPTNSDSALPRAAHLEGVVIGRHQCHHLAHRKCSGISRHVTPHAYHPPPPSLPPPNPP